MAALTTRAKTSTMLVVGRMTANAAGRERDFTFHGRLVTALALHALVLAGQRILRLPVVVEPPARPIDRIMTACAVVAEPPGMNVFLLMAGHTGGLRIKERRGCMTILAGRLHVFPKQWKLRQIMVKPDLFLPACFIVALAAPIAQLALVRIIIPMAADAVYGRRLHRRWRLVTSRTFDQRVPSLEGKLGVAVMLETHLGPGCFDMAVLAIGAQQPFVLIVVHMAPVA